MLIVDVKTPKKTKLHIINCVFCNKTFGSYRNKRKVCSKECKNKLNGIQKFKSTTRQCATCGNDFLHRPSYDRRGALHLYCSRSCQHPNKKLNLPVGQYFSYDKYIVLNKTPDGRKQIKMHRYIMEQHIGRILSKDEIVHHINNNRIDNRIENLQIVSRTEHNLIHNPKQ